MEENLTDLQKARMKETLQKVTAILPPMAIPIVNGYVNTVSKQIDTFSDAQLNEFIYKAYEILDYLSCESDDKPEFLSAD